MLVAQERLEIAATLKGIPGMGFLTAFLFVAEVRGYAKLYDDHQEHGGWPYMIGSFFGFLMFTDFCIYLIHRGLHSKYFYHLHKLHHKWKVLRARLCLPLCLSWPMAATHARPLLALAAGSHALCIPLLPLPGWLCAGAALPHLPVPLPAAQGHVPVPLCLCQHLDRHDPRQQLQRAHAAAGAS
jgi:sterol desaturase/sphingolipid hydroxylase (fatty acid hydroxylase superfamily)